MDVLQRFLDAQDGMYRIAYRELKNGRKISHWIWFIFPQLAGLGKSDMSRRYGLLINEVKLYLQHPILSLRLVNICKVLLEHSDEDINRLMGGELDAMKLQVSMTLFDWYSPNDIFGQVLDVFFYGNKHKQTLNILENVPREV